MKDFILDHKNIGEERVKLGSNTYLLKGEKIGYTFHIIPDNASPDSIEFSKEELKALFILLRIENEKRTVKSGSRA